MNYYHQFYFANSAELEEATHDLTVQDERVLDSTILIGPGGQLQDIVATSLDIEALPGTQFEFNQGLGTEIIRLNSDGRLTLNNCNITYLKISKKIDGNSYPIIVDITYKKDGVPGDE